MLRRFLVIGKKAGRDFIAKHILNRTSVLKIFQHILDKYNKYNRKLIAYYTNYIKHTRHRKYIQYRKNLISRESFLFTFKLNTKLLLSFLQLRRLLFNRTRNKNKSKGEVKEKKRKRIF